MLKSVLTDILFGVVLLSLLLAVFNTLLPVPFVPSSKKRTKKMVDAAELNKDDVVYDLGSGDGRIVILSGRAGVKSAVGFEINPVLNWAARMKAKLNRVNNTLFITKSIWEADLSKCSKLFVYLGPKTMKKLEKKILDEMSSEAIIISNSFTFPNLKLIKEIDKKIRVYQAEKK